MKITPKRMWMFQQYERVRAGGRWNMLDPHARQASGLSAKDYGFVMDNYDELADAADEEMATTLVVLAAGLRQRENRKKKGKK